MAGHDGHGPKLGLTSLSIEATGHASWEVHSSYSIIPQSGDQSSDNCLSYSFPIASDPCDSYETSIRAPYRNMNGSSSSSGMINGANNMRGPRRNGAVSNGYQSGPNRYLLDKPLQRRHHSGHFDNVDEPQPQMSAIKKGRASKRKIAGESSSSVLTGPKKASLGTGMNHPHRPRNYYCGSRDNAGNHDHTETAYNRRTYCDNDDEDDDDDNDGHEYAAAPDKDYRRIVSGEPKAKKRARDAKTGDKSAAKPVVQKRQIIPKKEKLPEAYYCVLPKKVAQFLAYIEYTARKGCVVEGTLGHFYSYDTTTLLKLTNAVELATLERAGVQQVAVLSSGVKRLVWSRKTQDIIVGIYSDDGGVGPYIVLRKLAFNGLLGRVHKNDAKIVCNKPIANLNVHKNMDHFIHNFPDEASKRRIPCYPAFLYRLLGVDGLRGVLGYTNFIPYMKNILLQTNGIASPPNVWLDLVNDMWTFYINTNRDSTDALVDGDAVYQFITGFTMYSVVELWDRQHLPRNSPVGMPPVSGTVPTPQPLLQLDKLGWWCDKHIEQLRRLLQDYVDNGVFEPFRSRITTQSPLTVKYNAALTGHPVHGLAHMLLAINGSAKQTDNDMTYRAKELLGTICDDTLNKTTTTLDNSALVEAADTEPEVHLTTDSTKGTSGVRKGFRFQEPPPSLIGDSEHHEGHPITRVEKTTSVKLASDSTDTSVASIPRYILPGSVSDAVAENRLQQGKKRVKLLATKNAGVNSLNKQNNVKRQKRVEMTANSIKQKRKKSQVNHTSQPKTDPKTIATLSSSSSSSSSSSVAISRPSAGSGPPAAGAEAPKVINKVQVDAARDLSSATKNDYKPNGASKDTPESSSNKQLLQKSTDNFNSDANSSEADSESSKSCSELIAPNVIDRQGDNDDDASSESSASSESPGTPGEDNAKQIQRHSGDDIDEDDDEDDDDDGNGDEETGDDGSSEKLTTEKQTLKPSKRSMTASSSHRVDDDAEDSDFPADDE